VAINADQHRFSSAEHRVALDLNKNSGIFAGAKMVRRGIENRNPVSRCTECDAVVDYNRQIGDKSMVEYQ
jgi:hypothetical protein